ncbi:zinc finger protein 462-like [Toxotes jaculatrix]|uniref:zinc finger protein 462-like n=1 Tax=Toxotes jaculatrix TaxID=941984 RepID=UPI001B3B0A6B|nr:zinc finger protein 462-like [Toxotes jaculatrix]
MQKDSVHFSTSGQMMHNQAVTQESLIKPLRCNHCTLIFKSKVYLFQHLNEMHGFDVDAALREAGLKLTDKATDKSSTSGNTFSCQHCDFKACNWSVLNQHEKQCNKKSEDGMGNPIISENPETKITVVSTNQHRKGAVMSTSKTTPNSSKDLKTYKRPLQTITKYFAAPSGSDGKPSVTLAKNPVLLDSTKGTLILQESPSSSSPNSSGVFKVTAKSMIDLSKTVSDQFLLSDYPLIRPTKRTNSEHSESQPAKKAKVDQEKTKLPEKTNAKKELASSSTEFFFDISEDEEEKKVYLCNRNKESPEVYFCKHCDYSDVDIRRMCTHYQNSHPHIRYNAVYIQDPSDQSATFRCLECPVEFLSVADLKRHYTENHPEAAKLFTVHSQELSLVFKCFLCPYTTNELKVLKEHYKEEHPRHKVDNSLWYCRYSATRVQDGSSQLNTCEKVHSLEKSEGMSPKNAKAQYEEVKNAPSSQQPTSKEADMVFYHCSNCKFSHKSVVVMHVHYQKSHPEETVTIDKIKQLACVTSPATSQMTPEKFVTVIEHSTSQKNIPDTSEKARDEAELSQQRISVSLMNTPDATKTRWESPKTKEVKTPEDRNKTKMSPTNRREMSAGMDSPPDKMFYCQFCSYSSTSVRSIIGHHNAKHSACGVTGTGEILGYSAEVQKKKLQSEAQASTSTVSSDSKTSELVEACGDQEMQHKEDDVSDASMTGFNPYARAENLFYCQKCNFGNPTVKGVLNHQAIVHHRINSSRTCIIEHTASIRDEIAKSKSRSKELPFSTHLPLPLINEGDENMFFCHYCNYRQNNVNQLMKHYFKRHRGFEIKAEQIRLYTSVVLKQTQKSHLKTTTGPEVNHASLGEEENKKNKTKTLTKCLPFSVSPSVRATQTQRILRCHRCSYSSQYVYLLRRHMWRVHLANRSINDVLKVCFKQGMLQSGYHCDLCVFSHKSAEVVYKHYQEQHPGRKLSFEYVSTRLYVGPDTCPPKRKKLQIKYTDGMSDDDGTDGSLQSQRFGQNETKMYSCRACSFKGRSVSCMTRHYRAVHPWSVKEDGSVLNVTTNKKSSANSNVEDLNEMPLSFDSYQVPLEFVKSPGSSHETPASPLKCRYCPAVFHTQRGLSTHCGMKHQEAASENLDEQQVQMQTRVHVFKCPYCTYVNNSYQGVLTHCQMKHPAFVSRADSLHVDETHVRCWDDLPRKGPGDSFRLSGYMCKTCSQIYATLEKLNKHCENDHNETVPNRLKPARNPSAVSKRQQSYTHSSLGSVSKASFLRKKAYAVIKCQHCSYSCSTKLALSRHLRAHHRYASVPKVKDCVYKCVLCSRSYFRKKRLGDHYTEEHGKDAFLKYYAPIYKQAPEKSARTPPDCPSAQQPENTSDTYQSITMTEQNKILVYSCPSCPYVNASYHGTLTHCQMKHPTITARADELKTDEVLLTNMVGCTTGKGSNKRGFLCKKCPQIYASLIKLKVHCERDHSQAEQAAYEHSAETKEQSYHGSAMEAASLQNKTCQVSAQNKESLYECHMCTYKGMCRKYLHCHYKKTHKLDALSTYKQLEKYNKRKRHYLPKAASEESAHVKCKKCPNLAFDSSQLLIAHYSTFHRSECTLDFTVLSKESKKSLGIYKCAHCRKQLNGIRKLCRHLDNHRAWKKKKTMPAKASFVTMTTPEAASIEICKQDELPMLETVEELTQWNVRPAETFTLPTSPLPSPSKPTDVEQPELESRQDRHTCKQCGRTFMSLKGLRSHERSHAALAAIKKLVHLPTSPLNHNINKYVLYKSGTIKPFLCSFCSYRTTVLGLWRSHFMKAHQDVIQNLADTDSQNEEDVQRAQKEPPNLTEEKNHLPEPDEEPEMTEKALYLEPPDVQRQLNHYSLMAHTGVSSIANLQETELPENSLLHCEFCNFNTGHLSSMRRHYSNRHGKKILRCKDCNFFTGIRKTLEMHMETGHSTCQSEPTHQKDLRCPFCLYQTKNKNNMIDHIVLHREERVVPIEVRRPKLSRYLKGIVFRCHKCTFTSGSAENLRLHMMRHDDIKPYKCRLCYFDCTLLSDLEAHLSDKHQVVRNHELVGQVSLDQLEARVGRMPEEEDEPLSDLEHRHIESKDVEMEEFVTVFNDVLHETQAENLAVMKDAYPKHEQDPQEQEGTVFMPVAARGQRIEDIVEQNVGKGSKADTQFEGCCGPERVRQTNDNQAQAKLRGSEDSSIMFSQQKEEAAVGSSRTDGRIAEKTEAHKLAIKAFQHKALNIEARVEHDTLHRSIDKIHERADQDATVKIEPNIENDCVDNTLSEVPDDGQRTDTLTDNPKLKVSLANNIRGQESFKVERHLPTLLPSCAQLKITNKESLDVPITECKEEQMCKEEQVHSEEATDPYGEMPVLENEYLKEMLHPLGCHKEEEEENNDHLEQRQNKEEEVITEANKNRCKDQEHEEGDRIKEADSPHTHKSAFTATGGPAAGLCPSVTEKKLYTCEFCGRNLMNSSELKRHTMRHGI